MKTGENIPWNKVFPTLKIDKAEISAGFELRIARIGKFLL